MRISGPIEHKSLAVYFLHDESRGGPVPLTLQEALLKGDIRIDETGDIHELSIENIGETPVFVQAGDIVKGGRQDRVLGVSMVVPARSGRVPIAAFCVEAGRWARRGFEDIARFSSSDHLYSAPRAKMALRRSAESYDQQSRRYMKRAYASMQSDMWAEVDRTQTEVMQTVGASARAAASPTSLELSLGLEEVKAARAEYEARLQAAAGTDPSIVGAVFAVGGRMRNAEAYPWGDLFARMWAKNLGAGITEALRAGTEQPGPAPTPEAIGKLLGDAAGGAESLHDLPLGARLRRRISQRLAFLEAIGRDGLWVHRSVTAEPA